MVNKQKLVRGIREERERYKEAGPYMVVRGSGRGEMSNKEPQEPSDRSWHFYLEKLANS